MTGRAHRLATTTAGAAGAVVVTLSIAHWGTVRDNAEVWRFLATRQTRSMVPRPNQEGLQVVLPDPADAGWLLRFVADHSGRPVIIDPVDLRRARQNPVRIGERIEGPTADDVVALLRSRGWRMARQTFPQAAYVVLRIP